MPFYEITIEKWAKGSDRCRHRRKLIKYEWFEDQLAPGGERELLDSYLAKEEPLSVPTGEIKRVKRISKEEIKKRLVECDGFLRYFRKFKKVLIAMKSTR